MLKRGFTLVELLIVMAVIAILVAIAVPAFRGMRQEANITKAQGDLKVVKIALESYYKSNNSYPTASSYPDTTTYQTALLAASPRILEGKLYDPFVSGSVGYSYSLNGSYYVAYSVGPSGGTATVNASGEVTAGSGVVWVSNGYAP